MALHGIGLNVSTRLEHFDLILPCGLQDTQMTSLQREYDLRGMNRQADMDTAKAALTRAFVTVFQGYDWSLPQAALPPRAAAFPSSDSQGDAS